ncbi:MAG: AlpA family phage regulatory protein [Agarilytica sp.]
MKHYLKLIRKPEVLEQTGYSDSTLYSRINQGMFVPPVSLGERAVAWISIEVDALLTALAAGKPKHEIKLIVTELILARELRFNQLKEANK